MLTLLTVVVACYLVFLLWLLPEMMETVPMDTKYWKVKILAAVLMAVPAYLGLQWCAYRFSGAQQKEGNGAPAVPADGTAVSAEAADGKEKKRRRLWFLFGFAIVFAWLMVYFYAYFPGSFDWDNLDQWWQIQNSQYDTWHPVFHTLLIALFSKIVNHYGFAVFMQLLLYSLLCGYLLYTMAKWRFPAWGMLLAGIMMAAYVRPWHIIGTWDWKAVGALAVVVIVGTILSFAFYMEGVRLTGAQTASLIASVEPVTATVATVLMMGVAFTLPEVIGIVIIIIAVIILSLKSD